MERSELFSIIGIAALFIVFPSATVANENPPFAKEWKIGEQGARISDRIFGSNPISKNLSFT
jgi:hypothetical protein